MYRRIILSTVAIFACSSPFWAMEKEERKEERKEEYCIRPYRKSEVQGFIQETFDDLPIELCHMIAEYGSPFYDIKCKSPKGGLLLNPWKTAGTAVNGMAWQEFVEKLENLKAGNFLRVVVLRKSGDDDSANPFSFDRNYFETYNEKGFDGLLTAPFKYIFAKVTAETDRPLYARLRTSGRCYHDDFCVFQLVSGNPQLFRYRGDNDTPWRRALGLVGILTSAPNPDNPEWGDDLEEVYGGMWEF